MKLTFGCGFGFGEEMEENEMIFGLSNLSLEDLEFREFLGEWSRFLHGLEEDFDKTKYQNHRS